MDNSKRFIQAASIALSLFAAIAAAIVLGRSQLSSQSPAPASGGRPVPSSSLVADAIRETADDPGSVRVEKILYSWRSNEPDGHVHQYALACYRTKNPFGNPVYLERVARIIDGRKVVWLHGEEAEIFRSSSDRWVTNLAGPSTGP
jgi:hypothetical protein